MQHLFEAELALIATMESQTDAFTHLASTLRSLYQVAAVSALEIVKELTPDASENSVFSFFAKRFNQPTDGLPVEILEVATPVIRAYVSQTYHIGWFEADPGTRTSLAADAAAWVAFRNKKPGHGVVSVADIQEWTPKLRALLHRSLSCFSDSLPRVGADDSLNVLLAGLSLRIQTPLLRDGGLSVITSVSPRKGIWKLEGQILSWAKSHSYSVDLPSSSVFEELETSFRNSFTSVDLNFEGETHSVINNVPVRQTSTFEGRSNELGVLAEWMNDPDEQKVCLIFGEGGFGKTTLALEFLNRILDGEDILSGRPPSVICYYSAKKTKWTDQGVIYLQGISDAMEDCVREILYCLMPVLDKEYFKLNGRALIDRVADEFSKQGFSRDDILLVLDNTETLATSQDQVDAFSKFLKHIGKRLGRVLVTSRRREYVAFEPLQITALSDEESTSLMRRLAEEHDVKAIKQAGEPTLRQAAKQLSCKPLLIDTLVKYLARSPIGISEAIEKVFRKTNDQLLEFLYEDAWLRINELQQDLLLVLVSAAVPLNSDCVADACALVGIQHAEFQKGLDETYLATSTNYGDRYDLQFVELAGKFLQQQLKKRAEVDKRRIIDFARKVDAQATHRERIERMYRQDRVAEAFRSQYAKAAKIAGEQGDVKAAELNFNWAIEEEPMNAALHDRFAWFLLHRCQRPEDAHSIAEKAVKLDQQNADAWLTLALCCYRLGDIPGGDKHIEMAKKKGKPESLCFLRKAIPRYYAGKNSADLAGAAALLLEGARLIELAIKAMNPEVDFSVKNLREARRYEQLFLEQRYRLRLK